MLVIALAITVAFSIQAPQKNDKPPAIVQPAVEPEVPLCEVVEGQIIGYGPGQDVIFVRVASKNRERQFLIPKSASVVSHFPRYEHTLTAALQWLGLHPHGFTAIGVRRGLVEDVIFHPEDK